MLISLALMALIAAAGCVLTYIFSDDEPLIWRCSAGAIIGSAIFGTTLFVLGFVGGVSVPTVLASLAIAAAPLLLLLKPGIAARARRDRQTAFSRLQGVNASKLCRFAYYLFFLILFVMFFERVMYVNAQGIFTGGSNNLGDLPFHLGAIYGFLEAGHYPPDNPSYFGAKFTYPFIADLITAGFMRLGTDLKDTMLVQNVIWALSLLVVLERFAVRLTADKLAGKLVPALLFFSGGLGFLYFFADAGGHPKGFVDYLWHLPKDFTVGDFRWSNSLTTLFLTQRSLLLGMPLTLVVLSWLWKIFISPSERPASSIDLRHGIIIGFAAGLLPLVHLHSLIVLFFVTALLFAMRIDRWKEWVAFGIGVSVTALPMLIWTMTGSATRTSEFIGLNLGWNDQGMNFIWFWLKNTGLLFPLLAVGIILVFLRASDNGLPPEDVSASKKDAKPVHRSEQGIPAATSLLLFYIPFALIFILCNVFKFAPWDWDNIKLLIYWFAVSVVFVAYALSWAWQHKNGAWKMAAAISFALLIFSGSLDVWRTVSKQVNMLVFDNDAVALGERLRSATPKDALFVNAPTYNSAVVLSGRPSLMRYNGHLLSHGIDYVPRENDVKTIYSGGDAAVELMRKYGVQYVLISPEERNVLRANEAFFASHYPVASAIGQYKVYKIEQ